MIKIEIEKSNKVNADYSAYLTFDYSNQILSIIRGLPERYWNPDNKTWEIPIKYIDGLMLQFDNNDLKYSIDNEMLNKINKKDDNNIKFNFDFKTNPYQHQIEGMRYGLLNDNWLLADEPGLGKTKQIIDIACYKKQHNNYKHCLIICCINGLKWNWKNEILTHSNEKGYILGSKWKKNKLVVGSLQYRLHSLDNLPDDYFIITNIETLRNKDIVTKLKKMCDNNIINMIAVDEFHVCKNPSSQQSKGLLKLNPEYKVAMTGTPLINKPLDLYVILKWLGKENHNFYQFKNYYCIYGGYGGYEILGYKNIKYLKDNLDEIMLRRKKVDVLDLPEKLYQTEYVEMNTKQNMIYKEVKNNILLNITKIKQSVNPLSQLIRLRQATGYTGIISETICESAKMDRMKELVQEFTDDNKKIIIYSNWTKITDEVIKELNNYNVALITGQLSETERKEQQYKFMNEDNCKIMVGTIGAMGTGLTLTAATIEIFMDEPWNRAKKEQAEDRAHRIGTTENITIITLITKDTIDERIHDIVYEKGKIADLLVDGKIEKLTNNTIDKLLN